MREQNQSGIFKTSLTWIASTLRKFIWKSNPNQALQNLPIQNIRCHLSKKTKEQAKQIVLMKLRKPSSQAGLSSKINKIKKFMEKKTQFEKPQQLVCPICIDMLIKSVVTPCGHSFCFRCLDEALLFNSSCPVCRTSIRGSDMVICRSLNDLIITFLYKFSEPIYKQTYEEKVKDYEVWINKRNINVKNISVGDLIDVRDTENIWCKSVINEIYKTNGQITSILVHYIGWNCIYDEIIDIDSQRLACYRFYSYRVDIPHYHLNHENQDNMYSYVVIGQPYLPNLQRIHNLQSLDYSLDVIEENLGQNNNVQLEQRMQGDHLVGNVNISIHQINPIQPIDYLLIGSQQNSDNDHNPQIQIEDQENQRKQSYRNFLMDYFSRKIEEQKVEQDEQPQIKLQIINLESQIQQEIGQQKIIQKKQLE